MTIGKSSMMAMNMGTGLRVSLKRKCKPVSKIIAQEREGPACDNVCPYSRKFRTSAIPSKMVRRRRRRCWFQVIFQSNSNLDGGNYFDGDIYCANVVSVFD